MAITRISAAEGAAQDDLHLLVNNGDLAALKDAVSRLQFKDEESLLRYVLAVLSKSATRTLTVIDKDGKSTALNPAAALLNTEAQQAKE